jgi:hypothetical protein
MMGIFVGNFLGLLIVSVTAALGYSSLAKATLLFLGTAYGIWLLFWIMNITSRPKVDAPFCKTLSPEDLKLYRHYHTAIDFPLPGQVYAGILNFLRVAGLVYAGLSVWRELYIEAGFSVLFFLITASLIHRNNPWFFLGQRAEKGHARAKLELQGLHALVTQRHGSTEEAANPSTEE